MPPKPRICIVGNLTLDVLPSGETVPGGSPWYAGQAAAVMGCEVFTVTAVGGDYPREYLRQLESMGVEVHALFQSGRSTSYAGSWAAGERILKLVAPGPVIPPEVIENISADAVLFSPVAGEIRPEYVKSYQGVKCLDLQGFIRKVSKDSTIYLARLSETTLLNALLVHASAEEVRAALGIRDTCAAVRKLKRLAVKNVIVGLREGILVASKDGGDWFTPTMLEGAVDGTGAGDILTGAFMASLLKGHSVTEAVAESTALLIQSLLSPPPYRISGQPDEWLVEEIRGRITLLG
jgi:sugar/nucleoside kinase (ribokinase family)